MNGGEESISLRESMVKSQIINRGIKESSVLDAFYQIPREVFTGCAGVEISYGDHPISIGSGQTISQPYIVALMTEQLLSPFVKGEKKKILEIGTGSGYQAAIIAAIGHDVYSIERKKELYDFAFENLSTVSLIDKVHMKVGDGCQGWEEESPYDGIIVTAAAPKIPEALLAQLKYGGRLVIPCGNAYMQNLLIVSKNGKGEVAVESTINCRFVPLIGYDAFREG